MNKITAILNCYNRSYTLDSQIKSLRDQTMPCDIIIWYNKGDNEQKIINEPGITTIVCNKNFKFHGRFTPGLLVDTEYVAIFDDDIIPGSKWFENCIEEISIHNGIMGGSGVTLSEKRYMSTIPKHGWNGSKIDKTIRVDLVGHAWFFKKEWLKYMWQEDPITWDNGEDIMFSFLCQKHGKINTFVPKHPPNNKDYWSNVAGSDWGNDENASFKKQNHYGLRDKICKFYIDKGWDTVNKIK